MTACSYLLVVPLPLPFMDVEVLRRLLRTMLRPLRDVGLCMACVHHRSRSHSSFKSMSYYINQSYPLQ